MSSTIRISGAVQDSIVDGPGLRFAIFFQGCLLNCPECHNPHTHDPDGGRLVQISELVRDMSRNPILQGITLSGGEPFLQPVPAATLAREARVRSLDVWCYTGMLWENLTAPDAPPEWRELLQELDVLVDGPFISAQRSLELLWRGSGNQRLIDVRSSLSRSELVLFQAPL